MEVSHLIHIQLHTHPAPTERTHNLIFPYQCTHTVIDVCERYRNDGADVPTVTPSLTPLTD
jgi:hypothetical protein